MSAMKDIDDFLPSIRPYAPGVADPTAYFAIRQAAIEFCERTRLWRFDDEFSVVGDDCEALLTPPSSVVHEIDAVWFNGVKLRHVTPGKLDELLPTWRAGQNRPTGQPSYVTQTEPNTIVLAPFGTGTVKLSLFLKPSPNAGEFPDFIVDQHRETIAFGALSRILLIPNQSFTDAQMAAVFGQTFQSRVDSKSAAGIIGQQRAPVRTKASYF